MTAPFSPRQMPAKDTDSRLVAPEYRGLCWVARPELCDGRGETPFLPNTPVRSRLGMFVGVILGHPNNATTCADLLLPK